MRFAISRLIPSGSFAQNVTLLTSGTTFAQGLAVLSLPLLTRLYTPHDFELLAVYAAILGIVTVASCLRYNLAIPMPKDDADGIALLAIALSAAAIISLLLVLPALIFSTQTAVLLGQPDLEPYLWMVPLGVFLASAYNALQYWATRKKRFGLVTRTRVTRSIGGFGAQASLGMITTSPFGLILGHMLYGGLGVIGLVRNLRHLDGAAVRTLSLKRVMTQAAENRKFPLWSVPEAILNKAAIHLPLILIAATAVGPEAGFLMLAMRVIGLPTGMIGSSIAQVFAAEAPAKYRDGLLATFTMQTMWALFKFGAPPIIVIGCISPLAFSLVFGSEWERAGVLVAWLTPCAVLQFVASPVSISLAVIGRQKMAMLLQLVGFIVRVVPLMVIAPAASTALAEIYAIAGALFYAVYILTVGFTVSCASEIIARDDRM